MYTARSPDVDPHSLSGPQHVEPESETYRKRATAMARLARDLGADYLLLVGGFIDSTGSDTPLSVIDLTLVSAYLVPTRQVDVHARTAAALVDVEDGRVVFVVGDESRGSELAPTALGEKRSREMMLRLRSEVVTRIAAEALARMDAVAREASTNWPRPRA